LEIFEKEQWQLHESLRDSEKAIEVMAINMGPKKREFFQHHSEKMAAKH
jgi:hypothetical protein